MNKPTTQPAFVKSQLILAGWRTVALARHLGIHYSYVSNLIAGRSRNPKWQQAIADLIGMSPAVLWGEFLADELRKGAA